MILRLKKRQKVELNPLLHIRVVIITKFMMKNYLVFMQNAKEAPEIERHML